MRQSSENYVAQTNVETTRRRALFVWSVSAFVVFFWLFLILLAPFAATNNLQNISNPLYRFFSFVCHQIPERSFHIENHAFAVCARCFGVYFGLFAGLIAYPVFRPVENLKPLRRVWLFAAMLPMALDFSLDFFGVWTNTHWSRFVSGAILGAACAVFVLPALVEIAQILSDKIKRPSR